MSTLTPNGDSYRNEHECQTLNVEGNKDFQGYQIWVTSAKWRH